MKLLRSLFALVASTAVLSGLGMAGGLGLGSALAPAAATAAARPSSLVGFHTCRGLGEYLLKHRAQAADLPYPGAGSKGGDASVAAPPMPPSGAEPDSPPSAPPSSTGTNVQEAGIDEPDIVKSAESAILVLADGNLNAVVTGPGGPVVADTLDMSEESQSPVGIVADVPGADYGTGPTSILVEGDLALVIGYGGNDAGPTTTLTEVDISDPTALRVVETTEAEGSFVSARQSGSTARLVISAYPDVVALRKYRGTPRRWLPSLTVRGGGASDARTRRLSSCRQVDRARRYSGSGLLTLLTLDLANGAQVLDSDAILTGGDTVYASADRMYVATQRWLSSDRTDGRTSDVGTLIHAFSTTEPNATDYLASGRVPGSMLSQWSMSERDGYLRVASTTVPPWEDDGTPAGQSESFVTVLGEQGPELVRVGQVGGLGRDERIYAVRFFDDVGYVVTFRQVDPLYTIDLSDPRAPAVVGELKIPGYSAYLHPVGDGLLLGVGQDADARGLTQGTQLSLFDISDPSAPTRIATQSLGRHASSDVEYDPHAFFFDDATGISITPFSDWRTGASGAVGVRVDPGGLSEVARLHHGDGWRAAITRSLARGDSVYTVSDKGVMRHDPTTLQGTGFATFPEPPSAGGDAGGPLPPVK
ncbi:MAG: beta-propeller domain-containing protein [Solirubrobacterales bacterium]|nr:beta-propeller domain-containing protein [Solirubrobacterales bacterium]